MKRGKEETKENSHKRAFVWLGLRIGLGVMIGLYIIGLILSSRLISSSLILQAPNSVLVLLLIFGVIQAISIFFTFVVSIIHLTKYKKKSFAVVALVLSSILLLLFLISFLIGGAQTP